MPESGDDPRRWNGTIPQVLSQLGVGLVIGNPERAVLVNDGFAALTGYSVDELMRIRPFVDLFAPEARDAIVERARRRLGGEQQPSPYETELLHRDGHRVAVEVSAHVAHSGAEAEIVATFRDLTTRKRVEAALASRARQQAVVAELGRRALVDPDVSSLRDVALRAVADTLDVEYATVFELLPTGEELLMRAGVGWERDEVGNRTVGTGRQSQAGFTVATQAPVVADGFSGETRFATPPLFADHGIVAGVTVLIRGQGDADGVLGAHTTSPRRFSEEDVLFLRGVGNVLADAIGRARTEVELATRARQQEAVAELGRLALAGPDGFSLLGAMVHEAARTLAVEYVQVLELLPAGDALVMRAGVGWHEGMVGHATVPVGMDFQAGFTLAAATPVVVEDLSRETRFRAPPLLLRHGVVSGLSVVIAGPEHPWGVLGAYTTVRRRFSADDTHFLQAVANVGAEAIRRAEVEAELRAAHERERALRRRLEAHSRMVVEAQEGERRRIARELHDEIGQTLTGLKLTLEDHERRSAAASADRLQRAQALTAELLQRVHDLSLDLRPAILDDLGLRPALMWLVERYERQTGVDVALECWGLDARFRPEIETAVYRIVQEALTNVARHAQTRQATAHCARTDDWLRVEVADQGIGFDVDRVEAGTSSGLVGMEERARSVGGRLKLDSRPGGGTRVSAELPLGERHSSDS